MATSELTGKTVLLTGASDGWGGRWRPTSPAAVPPCCCTAVTTTAARPRSPRSPRSPRYPGPTDSLVFRSFLPLSPVRGSWGHAGDE